MVELAATLFVAIVLGWIIGSSIENLKERLAYARRMDEIIKRSRPPRIDRDWMYDFNVWVLSKQKSRAKPQEHPVDD